MCMIILEVFISSQVDTQVRLKTNHGNTTVVVATAEKISRQASFKNTSQHAHLRYFHAAPLIIGVMTVPRFMPSCVKGVSEIPNILLPVSIDSV